MEYLQFLTDLKVLCILGEKLMENILFWKIQVTPNQTDLDLESKEAQLFKTYHYKDVKTKEVFEGEELKKEYKENSVKNPLFSRLHSLTLAFVKDKKIRVKYFTGKESDLINTFINTVRSPFFANYQLACFDAQFLLPFLGVRFDKNGVLEKLHSDLEYKNKRPWDLTGVCIRDFYQGAGAYRPNLKQLCYIFDENDNFFDWSEEGFYLSVGKEREVFESSVQEIKSVVNLYRKMNKLKPIDSVEVVEQSVYDVEVEEAKTLLHELHKEKLFDEDFKDRLRKQLRKRKLTKKDTPVVEALIKACYREHIDTIDRNRKEKEALNKDRDREVETFLETL